jgi:hypothetical protein
MAKLKKCKKTKILKRVGGGGGGGGKGEGEDLVAPGKNHF